MAPSVGPVHGSHATANARPATIGPPVDALDSNVSGRHWRFSLPTKSVATKSTPRAMMITPDICRSSWRLSWRKLPRPVAVMPSAMNMTVNERQKSSAGPRI